MSRTQDHAVLALEPEGPRVVIPGAAKPAAFEPPNVRRLHVRGGRLLAVESERVTATDLVTGEQVAKLPLRNVERGWLVGDGVFHLRGIEEDGTWWLSWGFTPFGGTTRELSRVESSFGLRR